MWAFFCKLGSIKKFRMLIWKEWECTHLVIHVVLCCVLKPVPGYCSFEDQGLCMWANTQDGDDLDWVQTQGQTASQNSGPDYDHTTGTYLGKNLQLLQFLDQYCRLKLLGQMLGLSTLCLLCQHNLLNSSIVRPKARPPVRTVVHTVTTVSGQLPTRTIPHALCRY